MSPIPGDKAGWYYRKGKPTYWDGGRWGEAPDGQAPAAVVDTADGPSDSVIGAGVILGLLVPVVGLLIGLVVLNKRGNAGIGIILVSLLGALIWYLAVLS